MVPFFPPLPPSILTSYPPSVLGAWCVVRGAWCVVVHSPPPGSWLLNPGHRPPATDHQSCFALSGPRAWWGPLPRALPWADLFGPLRGGGTAKFQGSGFRVQGSGFRDQGSGIRDQGPGIRDHRAPSTIHRFTDSPIHRFNGWRCRSEENSAGGKGTGGNRGNGAGGGNQRDNHGQPRGGNTAGRKNTKTEKCGEGNAERGIQGARKDAKTQRRSRSVVDGCDFVGQRQLPACVFWPTAIYIVAWGTSPG